MKEVKESLIYKLDRCMVTEREREKLISTSKKKKKKREKRQRSKRKREVDTFQCHI